jgi:hypothetical protein
MREQQRLERNANRLTECYPVFAEALRAESSRAWFAQACTFGYNISAIRLRFRRAKNSHKAR